MSRKEHCSGLLFQFLRSTMSQVGSSQKTSAETENERNNILRPFPQVTTLLLFSGLSKAFTCARWGLPAAAWAGLLHAVPAR